MDQDCININHNNKSQIQKRKETSVEKVENNENKMENEMSSQNISNIKQRNSEIVSNQQHSQNYRATNSISPKQQIHNSVSQNQCQQEMKHIQQKNTDQGDLQQNQLVINTQSAVGRNQRSSNTTNQHSTNQHTPIRQHQNIVEQNRNQQIPPIQQPTPSQHQGNTYFHNAELQDFEILSKLGEGSFSTVYRVKRGKDGKEYALKRIKMMKLNEKERENAVNEVRFLASIHSQNIISYKQAIYDEGVNQLCVIMEYAEGGDLARIIRHAQKAGKYIEEDIIWSYAIQMTNGIKALHDLDVLHRDLKAANVFLDKYQTRVMLGDLNVSKKLSSDGLLYTQTGTPYYASPEVWKDKPYNNKSDIWSLGCVIYEMCALKPPFKGKDMEDLFKKVQKGVYDPIPSNYSNELTNFIQHLLRVNPEQRPGCDEILNFSVIRKKINDIQLQFFEPLSPFSSSNQCKLISTIRIGKSLRELKDKLPKARYEQQNQLLSYSEILQPNQNHRQRKIKYTNTLQSSMNEHVNQLLKLPTNINNPSSDNHLRGLYENQGFQNSSQIPVSLRQSSQKQALQSQPSPQPSQKYPTINQILFQKQQMKQQNKLNQQLQQYGCPVPPQAKSRCSSVESKQSVHNLKEKMFNNNDSYNYYNAINKYSNINDSQNSILMGKKGMIKESMSPVNDLQPTKFVEGQNINQNIQQLSKEIKMLNSNIYNEEMNNRQKQLHQLKVLQQILEQKIKNKDSKNNGSQYSQIKREHSVRSSQDRSISLQKSPQNQIYQDQNESRSQSIEPINGRQQFVPSNKHLVRQSLNSQNQTPDLPRIFTNQSQNYAHRNSNMKERENNNILRKRMKTESTDDSSPTMLQTKDNSSTLEDKSQSVPQYHNQYQKIYSSQRKSQLVQKK